MRAFGVNLKTYLVLNLRCLVIILDILLLSGKLSMEQASREVYLI